MAATTQEGSPAERYVTLRGNAGLLSDGKAYLGTDHLLIVNQGILAEHLHRFYYSDIEALKCTRTRLGAWLSVGLGLNAALMLTAGLTALSLGLTEALSGLLIVAGGVLAVAAGINAVRGPTCNTQLHTRVYSARLKCFGRWRRAQAAAQAIQAQVAAVQGTLTPEVLASRVGRGEESGDAPRVVVGEANAVRRSGAGAPQPFRSFGITTLAVALLIPHGLACGLNALEFGGASLLLGQFLLALAMLMTVIALVRQYNTTAPGSVVTVTWVTFVALLLPYITNASLTQVQLQFQSELGMELGIAGTFSSVYRSVQGFFGVLSILTGLVGLIILLSNRERTE